MPRVPSVGLSPTSRPQFQAPGVVAYQGNPLVQQAAQDGARMQKIGQVVGQIGIQVEDKINDARTREFTNTFENGVNKLFLEYQQKKGKEGVDGLADFQKGVQELYDGSSPMLMNDAQRTLAKPIVDRIRSRADLRAQGHYLEASAQYEQTTNLQSQVVLADSIIANPEDPEALVQFGRLNNLFLQEARSKGMGDDQAQVFALTKRDKLFESVVTSALDSEDPDRIAGVEALMGQLPDGVMSQTQRQSLDQLVQKKSRDSQAIQWAASIMQKGSTYADAFDLIAEKAKTDPKMAEAWLEQLNKFTSAREKAEKEERGNLMLELSDKIRQGPLTAEDTQRASKAGILDELRLVEARLDITDDYGERILNELNRNPQGIIAKYGDDEGTVARMVDNLKAHVSQERLMMLTGQYNAFKSEQTGGRSRSGSGKTGKFNPFTASHTDITDVALLEHDARANADTGKTLQDKLETKYGEGQSSTRSLSLKTMKDRFHIEVVKRANAKWQTLTENERAKTDETVFLQEVAEEVYESGWVDQEHTRNIYTTEFRYGKPGEDLGPLERPMRRDELEPYQDQAAKELLEEERGRAVQQVFDQLIPGNLVLNRQELESRASKNVLGIPGGMTISDVAEVDAARARAASKISPADIDARAESLRQQAEEATKRKDNERVKVVTNDVTRKLMSAQYQNIDLSDGQYIEFKRWFGSTALREAKGPEGRRELWLQSLGGLKEEWLGSGTDGTWLNAAGRESTWEDLALAFYPGNERDLPGDVKLNLREIRRMYLRSGDMPAPVPDKRGRITIAGGRRVRQTEYKNLNEIPRFEALRWYFSRPGRQQ